METVFYCMLYIIPLAIFEIINKAINDGERRVPNVDYYKHYMKMGRFVKTSVLVSPAVKIFIVLSLLGGALWVLTQFLMFWHPLTDHVYYTYKSQVITTLIIAVVSFCLAFFPIKEDDGSKKIFKAAGIILSLCITARVLLFFFYEANDVIADDTYFISAFNFSVFAAVAADCAQNIKWYKTVLKNSKKYFAAAAEIETYVTEPASAEERSLINAAFDFSQSCVRQGGTEGQGVLVPFFPTICKIDNERYLSLLEKAEDSVGGLSAKLEKLSTTHFEQAPVLEASGAFQSLLIPFDWKKAAIPVLKALDIYNGLFNENDYKNLLLALENYAAALKTGVGQYGTETIGQFKKDYEIIGRGERGEKLTFDAMEQVCQMDKSFRMLKNYRIKFGESSAETDLLIICRAGVFCLEIKNYGENSGYSLVIKSDGKWFKGYGQQLVAIEGNPFSQNAMHMNAVKEMLGALLPDLSIPVSSIVTVPNDIEIINQSDFTVVHPSAIYAYISRLPNVISQEQIDFLYNEMSKRMMNAAQFPQRDYVTDFAKIDGAINSLNLTDELIYKIMPSEKYRRDFKAETLW